MNNSPQRAINQRFAEAFEKLKKQGLFKTQSEFVANLKWNQSTLSDVLKNKRPVPLQIAINFCNKYNVNQQWLLEGKGKMLSDETKIIAPPISANSSDHEKEIAEKDKIIAHLKTIIDAQDRIIKWMEHFMNKPRKSIAASVKSKN